MMRSIASMLNEQRCGENGVSKENAAEQGTAGILATLVDGLSQTILTDKGIVSVGNRPTRFFES